MEIAIVFLKKVLKKIIFLKKYFEIMAKIINYIKIIVKKPLTRGKCCDKIVNCNIIANYVLFGPLIMAKNGAYYIYKEKTVGLAHRKN